MRKEREPEDRDEQVPVTDEDDEPDVAEEHDSLMVGDDPIDKPAESDARWA